MGLEVLIKAHDFIYNNETGKVTRPTRGQATSILDLTFTTPSLGVRDSWIIDRKLATAFNKKLIVFDMANLNKTIGSIGTYQEATG